MTQDQTSEIESYGITHIGKVREDNQDAIRMCSIDDEFTPLFGHLYAIADGMGGYSHGAVASIVALTTFFDTFYASNGLPIPQKLKLGIQNANISVYQTARRLGVGRMGSTLTALHISGHTLHVAHVGDSRAYLIRDRESTCLTNDHTRVGELVRMRLLTPDKVRTHTQRSVLSKSIGLELFINADITRHTIQNADRLILCSDGVWSVIEDEEFTRLSETSNSAEQLCQKIFNLAMERDSDDNLSVITIFLRKLIHKPRSFINREDSAKFSNLFQRFSRWRNQNNEE